MRRSDLRFDLSNAKTPPPSQQQKRSAEHERHRRRLRDLRDRVRDDQTRGFPVRQILGKSPVQTDALLQLDMDENPSEAPGMDSLHIGGPSKTGHIGSIDIAIDQDIVRIVQAQGIVSV